MTTDRIASLALAAALAAMAGGCARSAHAVRTSDDVVLAPSGPTLVVRILALADAN